MTSILEALRELEEERRRARTSRSVSVADAPPDPARPASLLYPLVAGLAVGVLAVGLVVWWLTLGARDDAPTPTPAAVETAPVSGNTGLGWLERAEAPEARVERAAAARSPVAADSPRSESIAAAPAPSMGGRAGAVALESIRYAAAPEQRSVTLRLDGRRVTLRQGGRASGIEVQLILKDGAYLNRGSEVFFATPEG